MRNGEFSYLPLHRQIRLTGPIRDIVHVVGYVAK